MSAPLKIKIYYMSAQQNMGENLVFIPHQILIFDVEIFDGALKFRVSNDWGRRSRLRKFLAAVRLKFSGTVAGSYSGQHFFFILCWSEAIFKWWWKTKYDSSHWGKPMEELCPNVPAEERICGSMKWQSRIAAYHILPNQQTVQVRVYLQ